MMMAMAMATVTVRVKVMVMLMVMVMVMLGRSAFSPPLGVLQPHREGGFSPPAGL